MLRVLDDRQVDSVSGAGSKSASSSPIFVVGSGNGGFGQGGIAVLSGNSAALGLLTGRTSSSGSAANGSGGNGGTIVIK